MADLESESAQLAAIVSLECKKLRTLINGNALDLSSLDTTAKTSLVDAINELVAAGGGGGTTLTNYSQIADLTGYPTSFPPIIGSGATQAVAGNDARLTDSRAPTAHKSTHATGGADALAPSDIGAIPATGGTMTNGTIAGTLTVNSTSFTFGTGSAVAFFAKLVDGVESTARTELGATTIGDALFTAASIAAARSTLGESSVTRSSDLELTTSASFSDAIGPFTLEANTSYKLEYYIPATWTNPLGLKARVLLSGGASNVFGDVVGTGIQNRAGTIQSVSWATSGTVADLGAMTASTSGTFVGFVNFRTGASGGTAYIQAAQNTTGSPSSFLKSGAYGILKKA